MTAPMPCANKCGEPATHDADAGYKRVGDHLLPMTRPLCDWCGHEDVRARAEKRSA